MILEKCQKHQIQNSMIFRNFTFLQEKILLKVTKKIDF